MTGWEYRKIDLNDVRRMTDDIDLLADAGKDGWELVGITSNNFAYLKRQFEELAPALRSHDVGITTAPVQAANADGYDDAEGRGQGVKVKYRDPVTGDTWTGRGRMANWLKRKQDAGEDIDDYEV